MALRKSNGDLSGGNVTQEYCKICDACEQFPEPIKQEPTT